MNILIILNDPPYGSKRSTMQALAELTLNVDKVMVF
jgi:sulfur relay (sulfurtransferase) complex TusBCD TusD component (DsrE family)